MGQHALGTLTLPWSTSSQRASKRVPVDPALLAVTLVLALIGVVMVFSASAVVAGNRFHDPWYFLKRQVAWLVAGLLVMHVISRIDYTIWKKLAIPLLCGGTLLLILVLIPSLGNVAKGARRWLHLGPINIQPAELAKFVAVIYVAAYLTKKQDQITQFARGLLPPLIVIGMLSGLVLLEPDLGTVVVMGLVVVTLLFLAGARLKHLGMLALCAVPAVAALILGSSYRRQRVMEFLSSAKDPTGSGYQINQSFLAFGSGGPFGVGLGEGKQKLFFLPEAHTDFVLALVGEELGLMGTVTIMLLFGLFVIKGFQIASRARNPFGRHLAMGITMLIGMQALVNAGVVTGLLPTKGLTLPFVSYGGSSLVANLFGVGLLLSISRDRQGGQDGGPPRGTRKRGVMTE
ncbi:MAG TPA: putative lipid II flippase FtsW [Nitrospira sp.]|jgi:cell division protein FtsW|nr:putative lipid II flippase FtsW [Nitrospira sp.]MBS0163019.1 putative lipid II flippase FtsW [Nitrospira sp.]MBS0172500.1 putative lipid II flippase FtsW [Nitrospira sp.]MBS0179316.1 putative lipid II flippase FtsW [Nitrospira sp.]MBX3339201.1 putative lipid II flippase FtsW [Nitrospira sp.]